MFKNNIRGIAEGALTVSSRRLSKVAVAIGGFLIFIGIIMLGVFTLTFFGVIDISAFEGTLESEGYRILILGILLVIGVLDAGSGFILRR